MASELLLAGLEVAFPARDRGIDLIAYVDVDTPGNEVGRFVARPIQMKAASRGSFGIQRKYERFHGLVLAFVWNLNGEDEPVTYALTYNEAVSVAHAMDWLSTASWLEHGGYGTTKPGTKLRDHLTPYRMTTELWRPKLLGGGGTAPSAAKPR